MAKNDAQYERIMSLMGSLDRHSMTESIHKNTNVNNSSFQYQMIGGDGKSYAIVREGAYYYIKSADAKKQNIAEAYDYLGGWMGRKNFEYKSYNAAYNNFVLKMRQINENRGLNTVVDNAPKNEYKVMDAGAVAMQKEIARQCQIMESAGLIQESGYGYKPGTTEVPEAPKKNSGSKDGPFTEKASANLDKDFRKTAGDPDNQSGPFGDGKAPAKGKDVNDSDIPTDGKAVAVAKPKGGKVTRVNEGTGEAENGVISNKMKNWGIKDHGHGVMTVDKADMDAIHIDEELDTDFDAGINGVGTGEIGDDAPFDEKAHNELDECGFNNDELCEEEDFEDDEEMPEDEDDFGDEEIPEGDEEDFEDDEEVPEDEDFEDDEEMPEDEDFEDDEEMPEDDEEDFEDDEEMPEDDDEYSDDDEEMPEDDEYSDDEEDGLGDDDEDGFGDEDDEMPEDEEINSDMDSDEEPMLGEDGPLNEAKQRYMNGIINHVVNSLLKEERTTLHDFGKHPGYRKKVMSLPQTGVDKNEHGKDWNDDSVYSEEPFGNKIGSSAPFEKAVKAITDSVMESLKKK